MIPTMKEPKNASAGSLEGGPQQCESIAICTTADAKKTTEMFR
jgi:ABC-type branched-subunit amino acid transport system ATPase component